MSKRIVICADGTWNRPEKNLKKDVPTNVLKLARAIKPVATDDKQQQVFYDWGIGSYHDEKIAGATGRGLHKNIMDDYRYIVQNYKHGDEIFLFGFSRGAFTIRSLCGLINNCGILKREHASLIQTAYDHYKNPSDGYEPKGEKSIKFRKDYSHASRKVKFVGVWDTVGAMGIPISFLGLFDSSDEFYDTKLGSNVQIARHALAIDEQRVDFEPTIWDPHKCKDIKQVWFAGVHSDIGGGYRRDADGSSLSDNPLSWMINEAKTAGLTVEPHLPSSIKLNPLARKHNSRVKFFRLKDPFHRPIEIDKVHTLVHSSVKKRWNKDQSYRPKNLKAFIANNGWPDEEK